MLLGAAVYSLGWVLTGWAVSRSRVFSVGDGTMLMIAAPLLGIAGALLGSLQTFGAIFVLAAGIGIGLAGRPPRPGHHRPAGGGGERRHPGRPGEQRPPRRRLNRYRGHHAAAVPAVAAVPDGAAPCRPAAPVGRARSGSRR